MSPKTEIDALENDLPLGNRHFFFEDLFLKNTPMLASGIKGMRIQLRFGSELPGSIFMRRRLGCPFCLQRDAPPPFHYRGIVKAIQ
ncbi:MAG: hypothetical protein WBL92_02805 [Methanothrix sp.]